MRLLIFDIETDGLLDTLTKIHCMSVLDVDHPLCPLLFTDTPRDGICDNGSLLDGVNMLMRADMIIGHNILHFDCPAIEKVLGVKFDVKFIDTQVLSELIWRDPRKHSLGAWGERLGIPKQEYTGGWHEASKEMYEYCIQDLAVTLALWVHICNQKYDQRAIDLEHELAPILFKATQYGFKFDIDAARLLYAELIGRRKELKDDIDTYFKPWNESSDVVTPKKTLIYKDPIRASRTKDASFTPIKLKYFNPNSNTQIIRLLQEKYNWTPVQYTKNHNPKLNTGILAALPYPEAKQLTPYKMIQKRLGQLAEGKKAWFNYIGSDNRIHGEYKQNGTITGRCAHRNPNMGQIPATRSEYGAECRRLFIVDDGNELTGIDATSIELCCLGHYLAPFDDGAFTQIIINGNKTEGTDVYSLAGKLVDVNREKGKRIFLSWMYGAFNMLLGSLVDPTLSERAMRKLGAYIRKKIESGVQGIPPLLEAIDAAYKRNGYLKGLDGRLLTTTKSHAYLNLLCQSAAGILLKRAMIILYNKLITDGYIYGKDWGFCAFVHDEFQIESTKGLGEIIGQYGVKSIKEAGEFYDFACPLTGEYRIGTNWYETH